MHDMNKIIENESAHYSFSERQYITALKGIAILCVVGIHILSSIKNPIFTEGLQQYFFITLDQLFRVSVPLFVALSGFAFARKYQNSVFSVKEFFSSQLFKLIPLYLFWSGVLILGALLIPVWFNPVTDASLWQIFFLGKADYHLYFIPMIFQLYLLFPILRYAMKKTSPTLVLIVTCAVQIVFYMFISQGLLVDDQTFILRKDQQQYVLALSWIGYFVLGMWLATVKLWQATHKKWITFSIPLLLAISFFVLVSQTISAIVQLVDPIIALRFTRIPVLLFSFVAIFALFQFSPGKHFTKKSIHTLVAIGELSFLIYLSHTLLLRIIFLGYQGIFTVQDTVMASVLLLVGIVLSVKWLQMQKKKK